MIDIAKRAELLERSPHNVVAVDLPKPHGETGAGPPATTPTRAPPRRSTPGASRGRPGRGLRAGDLGDDPGLHGPDGSTHTRHAILARVGVEDYGAGRIRPHERTLPGPKKDRLDLTRATRLNLSPIFSLSHRGRLAAGRSRRERASPGAR